MTGRRRFAAWMVTAVLLAIAGATSAPADPPDAEDPVQARVFRVHHRPLAEALEVVGAILSEDGQITLQPRFKRLVVQDHQSVLDRIGPLLESFDLPPREVEVTLTLFLASDPRVKEAGQHAPAVNLSREIRGVAETLPNFTKWTQYQSLGSRAVTTSEGGTIVARLSGDYRVRLEVETVQNDIVKFRSVTLERTVPAEDGGTEHREQYRLETTVLPGQTKMVGAAKNPNSARALFLALQVKPR